MAALPLALFTLIAASLNQSADQSADQSAGDGPDFAREVRPLLARRCFPCHGNDEATREAGLRLDLEAEATRDRDGYAAIVPGDLDESEVWARITDEFDAMPPEEAGEPLSDEERDLVRRWIEAGAGYAPHWAFASPTRPALPERTADESQAIDAFVRDALIERGLDLSRAADDYTLLRRVSLDLTGLPPTPEQARAYADSKDPAKFEEAVDRLLASPAYAERWAAVWLDLARYADSSGHGSDPLRTIWRYRDWVIDAFDRNMPFDEFTVQQLAGDILPEASLSTRLATAFHRNTMTNTEGGTDDEEFRVLAVKDRVNTTMQVWMGLTAGCAECHSHKYDPISHTEYYQLFDLFNQTADTDRNDDAPRLETPTDAQRVEHVRLSNEIASAEQEIATPRHWTPAERRSAETSLLARSGVAQWSAASFLSITGEGEEPPQTVEGGGLLFAHGGANARRTARFAAGQFAPTALRLRAHSHQSLPHGGPGRNSASGNFVLTDLQVRAVDPEAAPKRARRVRIELPGSNRILSLAEVEVLDASGERATAIRSVVQSSTAYGGPAEFAVDGNTSGIFDEHSVTHTATEDDPWWSVEFEDDVEVAAVRIWSRTDGRLEERLHGFRVVLVDGVGDEVWRSALARAPVESVDVGPVVGEPLMLKAASVTHEQSGFAASLAVDAFLNDRDGWAIGGATGASHAAVFALPALDGARALEITMRHDWGTDHVLASLSLSLTTADAPPLALAQDVEAALHLAIEDRAVEQEVLVDTLLEQHDPRLAALRVARDDLAAARDALGVVTTPVMVELPGDQRRATHIMLRGNFLSLDAQVHAAVPAAFPQLPASVPADRLALARWIVSDENPLTARVAANRIWGRLFGRGIVLSEGDFGSQGATPSHPDLLDWLAVEFRENGWDHKALLRTIVSSRTYRQSSRAHATSLENDPDAVWLSRFPRQRLEAEMVRDVILHAAGLLSSKRFGPSVFPPQPDGLWQAAFNGERSWTESMGEDRYRRGVYVFLRRTIPFPMLATFDAPSRETCTVSRIPTNTPLQAFVTMNDPAFHEAAQTLGKRCGALDLEREEIAGAILWATRVAPPTSTQIEALCALFADASESFRGDLEGARDYSGWAEGDALDPGQAAAWTLAASVALNLDSVLTKE